MRRPCAGSPSPLWRTDCWGHQDRVFVISLVPVRDRNGTLGSFITTRRAAAPDDVVGLRFAPFGDAPQVARQYSPHAKHIFLIDG